MQRGRSVSPPEDASSPGPVELVDAGSEREQLEAQIAAARERTAAAVDRSRRREADVRAALRSEIEATRAALAELERTHRSALDLVHEAAELAIERLRSAVDRRDGGSDVGDE